MYHFLINDKGPREWVDLNDGPGVSVALQVATFSDLDPTFASKSFQAANESNVKHELSNTPAHDSTY